MIFLIVAGSLLGALLIGTSLAIVGNLSRIAIACERSADAQREAVDAGVADLEAQREDEKARRVFRARPQG
jgi:hypothetical protein